MTQRLTNQEIKALSREQLEQLVSELTAEITEGSSILSQIDAPGSIGEEQSFVDKCRETVNTINQLRNDSDAT